MASLSDIRDWVRNQTLIESDDWSDIKVDNVINQGLRLLSARFPWPFLLTSETITSVADQQTYSLPSNHTKTHVIYRDGYRTRLREQIATDAWTEYGGDMPESDEADAFFIHNASIYLIPVPTTAGVTYTHHYWRTATELSNDTDEPEWAPQYHLILADYAIARAWEREEDFTKAESAQAMFDDGVEEMARYYLNRTQRRPMVFGESTTQAVGRTNMPFLDGA